MKASEIPTEILLEGHSLSFAKFVKHKMLGDEEKCEFIKVGVQHIEAELDLREVEYVKASADQFG